MSKESNLQRTLGMTLSAGAAGGAAAMMTNSWTKPITENRTLHGISGGGPAQGIVQGAPAATRTKSVYSYQRENPKKKWADAITTITGAAGAVAANMLLPGSGSAIQGLTETQDEPLSAFSNNILRGEIDPVTGLPVDRQEGSIGSFGPFTIKAPTNLPSILGDTPAIHTNGYMDILKGYVDPRYTGFLSDGLENNPLLKNWKPNIL